MSASAFPALDENQLAYLEEVLGLRSVLLPKMTRAVHLRIHGDLGSSALVCVFQGSGGTQLLTDSETELGQKMIEAMKLGAKDVLWLEWAGSENVPSEIRQLAHGSGFRPILCFGQKTTMKLVGLGEDRPVRPGSWIEWEGLNVMTTHSLDALLAEPQLKKSAWAHLQAVMKALE